MTRDEMVRERMRRALDLLARLGSIDNVPFGEHGVLAILETELRRLGLAPLYDRWGNLLARYQHGDGAPPLAMVAHTDHPAFEVAEVRGGDGGLEARCPMLGRVWPENFAHPVPVRIQRGDSNVRGIVRHAVDTVRGVELTVEVEAVVVPGDTGVWDLPGFVHDGDFVRMRSADDLGGCAVIVRTLEEVMESRIAADVTAIFTRAEEVGLVGALMIASAGVLAPETIVISLETSKALPGAEQGFGPVIRVGDYRRAFHPDGEALLLAGRTQLERRSPAIPVQRQLMSGGTCEATAFAMYDYRVTGVALPLGNYHNAAGADRIDLESIHLNDLSGAVDLLVASVDAAADPDQPSPADERARYGALAEHLAERLEATAMRRRLR